MARMKDEVVGAVIDGMKDVGINVVTSLPTHMTINLRNAIEDDPALTHVPVANEGDSVGICSGAWLGGRMGALLAQENGMILATYHLLGTMDHHGGIPMIMLIDMPGHSSFRELSLPHMYYYALYAPKILETLQLPYSVVTDADKMKDAIYATYNAAQGLMRPAALIMGSDLYVQSKFDGA